jgi:hypothetical protein
MGFWKKSFITFFLFNITILNSNIFSQEVPHSINNKGVYEFLDELANKKIISLNSVVKPYSRLFIAQRLKEAEEKKDKLNPRQQKELEFYLLDFGKELREERRNGMTALRRKGNYQRWDMFYYQDSLFSEGRYSATLQVMRLTGEMERRQGVIFRNGAFMLP